MNASDEFAKSGALPSKVMIHVMIQALSKVLKIDRAALEQLATADRIRLEFGTILLELSDKIPDLKPFQTD